ncbi:hypothetical protein [Sphaerisporangium fuscum]|uniref:hypothetical protein n=1 Tax=Sphaerisporangium fuscum TaxID=2835868 RepID=UPI001BDDC163|nr:hypothetical protein [Sphaerisporangium fuscum]
MTPPPPHLPALDVELPAWPAVDRARRRLDTLRSCTGRVTTVAGAAAAAVGLFTPDVTGASLLATATLSAAGLASLRLWKPDGHQKATATVLYLMPGTSLAALLVAERIVAGIHWGEALALTVWTTGTWLLRPARIARRMMSAPPPPAPATAPAPVEVTDGHPAARWWAQHVAVDGGAAPGTVLEDIERTGEASMRAVIRSAIAGRPVPEVSVKHLSALMDIPEEDITIGPVPGRGASVRRLTIGTPEQDSDPTTVWAQRIAPVAMPGAVLTSVRVGRPSATPTAPIPTLVAEETTP